MKVFCRRFGFIIPIILFTVLALLGTHMHAPWGDEAETLLFGKSILTHGVPYGWDGTNLMGFNDALVLNKDLVNHVSPWSQYYVAALGQAMFGSDYGRVRMLFLLFSVGSLFLLYKAVAGLSSDEKRALVVVGVASVSVQYILFSYQIRYYPLLLFFSALFLLGVVRMLHKKSGGMLWACIGGVGAIYSHYVAFAFLYPAVLVGGALYLFLHASKAKERKQAIIQFFLKYIGVGVDIALVFAPWYVLQNPSAYQLHAFVLSEFFSLNPLKSFWLALTMVNLTNVISWSVWISASILLIIVRKQRKVLALYGFFLGTILTFLVLTSVADGVTYSVSMFIAFRYQVIVLPLYIAFVGMLLYDFFRVRWWLGVFFFVLFIFTTSGAIQKPQVLLWDYAREVMAPPPTPDSMVANYLRTHATPGDTALVNLDRDYEPLMYAMGNTLRFVNRVSLTNPRLFPKNRSLLPRYIWNYTQEPDWVILYSKRPPDGSFLLSEYNEIPPFINLATHYDEVVVPVFFSDLSRPEIFWHTFYPITPGSTDQVFIYHKKSTP